jgi:DNA-binding NarL/FixJ family response regulator
LRRTVVLADDHPLILNGLEQLFTAEPEYEVVARCSDGRQALDAARRYKPHLLILDLRMPELTALDVLRALKDDALETRSIVLTASVNEDEVLEALRLGARGVVLKDMAPRLLMQCVRKVEAGERWLEKESVGRALDKLFRREAATSEFSAQLTAREMEIVKMVASGLRNKEIAERLFITEGTVKMHLHRIYRKVGVEGRVPLTILAREKGLV